MDAFLEAKQRINEINVPEEYKQAFLNVMDKFSAYFSAHPEITMDVEKTFNEYLYNNLKIEIYSKQEQQKKSGVEGGVYLLNQNKIKLSPFDVNNAEFMEHALTHEFTHFLIHNTYHPVITKEDRLWVDEMMTENVAKAISGKQFSTAYDHMLPVGEFLNSYFPESKQSGAKFTVSDFLNGKVYEFVQDNKLDSRALDSMVKNFTYTFISEYFLPIVFNAKLSEMPNILQGNATPEQLADFVRIKGIFDNTEEDFYSVFVEPDLEVLKGIIKYNELENTLFENVSKEENISLQITLKHIYNTTKELENAKTLEEKQEAQEKLNYLCNKYNGFVQEEIKVNQTMNEIIVRANKEFLTANENQFVFETLLTYISENSVGIVLVEQDNAELRQDIQNNREGKSGYMKTFIGGNAPQMEQSSPKDAMTKFNTLQEGESFIVTIGDGYIPFAEVKKVNGELCYNMFINENTVYLIGKSDFYESVRNEAIKEVSEQEKAKIVTEQYENLNQTSHEEMYNVVKPEPAQYVEDVPEVAPEPAFQTVTPTVEPTEEPEVAPEEEPEIVPPAPVPEPEEVVNQEAVDAVFNVSAPEQTDVKQTIVESIPAPEPERGREFVPSYDDDN